VARDSNLRLPRERLPDDDNDALASSTCSMTGDGVLLMGSVICFDKRSSGSSDSDST
jgi:hypothetical protein